MHQMHASRKCWTGCFGYVKKRIWEKGIDNPVLFFMSRYIMGRKYDEKRWRS